MFVIASCLFMCGLSVCIFFPRLCIHLSCSSSATLCQNLEILQYTIMIVNCACYRWWHSFWWFLLSSQDMWCCTLYVIFTLSGKWMGFWDQNIQHHTSCFCLNSVCYGRLWSDFLFTSCVWRHWLLTLHANLTCCLM